jgi:hypothetical protein
MARIDELAAEQEVQKAADYMAQADQLIRIAGDLRKEAREHLREAEQLRGVPDRKSR